MKFNVESKKVIDRLRDLSRNKAQRAMAIALYREGELLMAESKREVPVDTGALRASGHVQQPKIERDSISVRLGYGGPAAPYALYVHEDPNASHAPGTNYKYLEGPMKRRQRGMVDRIAESLIKILGK